MELSLIPSRLSIVLGQNGRPAMDSILRRFFLKYMVGDVMADNDRMIRLVTKLGFVMDIDAEDESLVNFVLQLDDGRSPAMHSPGSLDVSGLPAKLVEWSKFPLRWRSKWRTSRSKGS